LRLGFWNVRKLGQDTGKDVAQLCASIHAHFDVLALAEVMAEDDTGDVAALEACLSRAFRVLHSEGARPRGQSPHRETLQLFFRPESAVPCPHTAALRWANGPAAVRGGAPFLRPPAFACLDLQGVGNVLVGAYHARWGSGDAADIAREISVLDDLLAELPDQFEPIPDVLLFGDLNLVPAAVARASGLVSHTEGAGSTLTAEGEPTEHLFDQLLLGPYTRLAPTARVLDVRAEAGGAARYLRALSDHLPIVAQLARNRPQAPQEMP
jgi:endonuclease/exonuclease/phosphatase family metal-dependent hydrolase